MRNVRLNGDYMVVRTGDLLALIGQLDRLRARVKQLEREPPFQIAPPIASAFEKSPTVPIRVLPAK